MVSVLCVEHAALCGPGRLTGWLATAGVGLAVIRPYGGDALPHALDGYAGLVVLGGPMGALDDARAPWLPATRALLAAAVADRRPVLGVCLGHQLLAAAAGGTVSSRATAQRGPTPISVTPPGRDDPLFGRLPHDAEAVHWNNDLVTTPPPGAVVLASCGDRIQALRVGPVAYGVQFHPEADPAVVDGWAAQDVRRGTLSTTRAARLAARTRAADDRVARVCGALVRRWAALVATEV